MEYALDTVLTPTEADRLAETLGFTRKRTTSSRNYLAQFASAADRQKAELLIAQWRSEH